MPVSRSKTENHKILRGLTFKIESSLRWSFKVPRYKSYSSIISSFQSSPKFTVLSTGPSRVAWIYKSSLPAFQRLKVNNRDKDPAADAFMRAGCSEKQTKLSPNKGIFQCAALELETRCCVSI